MTDTRLVSWRDWNHTLEPIDLSSASAETSLAGDVIGKLITGRHENIRFHRNFLRCAFRNASLIGVNFDRVDSKDTSFIETAFVDCALTSGSTVSCTFANCIFTRCKFTDAAFHESFYRDCTFVECDFVHSMMRNSQVVECVFERCTTSNKLFEGCRLFSNTFHETWLDFAAITDNFGLDNSQLSPERLRENRAYPRNELFPLDARLSDAAWVGDLSEFDKLKLQYYLAGGQLIGSETVDQVFSPESWLWLVRAPINLMRLLQDFGDFIFRLYRTDRLPCIFVLKLGELAHSIWTGFDKQTEHGALAQAGAGTYFQCLQFLADLDAAVRKMLPRNEAKPIVLRSYDDTADGEIVALCSELQKLMPEARIHVLPRNSPVDILFSGLSSESVIFLVTLFFATKTRVQLLRSSDSACDADKDKVLFSLAVGGAKEDKLIDAVAFEQCLPGLMKIRFDVRYSTALVERMKKFIQAIAR